MAVPPPDPTPTNISTMTFDRYQRDAARTRIQVTTNHPIIYPTLGLSNEAGEFAGKVKKIFRDKGGAIAADDRQHLLDELGDVLWYLSELCSQLDSSLAEVAQGNLDKLAARQQRGTLHGNGDVR